MWQSRFSCGWTVVGCYVDRQVDHGWFTPAHDDVTSFWQASSFMASSTIAIHHLSHLAPGKEAAVSGSRSRNQPLWLELS